MIISFKHKYIFIKNRKVAGSSIQYILKKYLFDFDKDISSLFKLHDHELEKSNEFDKKYLDNINIDSSFNQHASLIDICDYLKINLREARKFFLYSASKEIHTIKQFHHMSSQERKRNQTVR